MSNTAKGISANLVTTTQTYAWQHFYEAAILETNRLSLPRLIRAAQVAIDARIKQMQADPQGTTQGTSEEKRALADALVGLTILRKEIHGSGGVL
jgi:hypothetical protein